MENSYQGTPDQGKLDVIKNNQVFIKIMEKYHSGNEYLQKQSKEEATALLRSFVYSIIKEKFGGFYKYQEDLAQSGLLGIVYGMEKYDATKSMPTTFFNFYIVHEMTEFVNTMVKKTTPHYASSLKKIMSAVDDFEDKGIAYTAKDISIATGDLPLQTITKALAIKNSANEMYYDNDDYLDSQISERYISPEQQYLEKEELVELYRALNELAPEEKATIRLMYGIGTPALSHKMIAEKLGITIESVRRLRVKALKKLERKPNLRKLFDFNIAEENILNDYQVEFVPVLTSEHMMQDIVANEINI